MDRRSMGDDDELEWQVEEGAEGGKDASIVPRGRPHSKFSVGRSESVCEDQRALFGKPERGFVAAASIIESEEAAGKFKAGVDWREVRLRDVVAEKETGTESRDGIEADKGIDIADVIGFQDHGSRRRTSVQAIPERRFVGRWGERIEDQALPTRFDECARDHRLPSLACGPAWMLHAPDP